MKMYAELPARRTHQVVLDLAVLAWVVLWVRVAVAVRAAVLRLAAPGASLESAGAELSRSLDEAAARTAEVPVLGDPLAAPLETAGAAAAQLAEAGATAEESTRRLALLLAMVVALAPVVPVLLRWLAHRIRWSREAAAAARLRLDEPDEELLALRALVHRPLHELARVHPRPGAAYRSGDPSAVRALAGLELASLGLRPADSLRSAGHPVAGRGTPR